MIVARATIRTVDPLIVARELRNDAEQYKRVGRSAKDDHRGRAATRYGRRARRLIEAAEVIEMLVEALNGKRQSHTPHAEGAAADESGTEVRAEREGGSSASVRSHGAGAFQEAPKPETT